MLAERGQAVTTVDVPDGSSVGVEAFEAVLVGSPVYTRRHRPEVVAFVERNRGALAGAVYWLVVERGRRPGSADGRARDGRAEPAGSTTE